VTLLVCVIDAERNVVELATAGHPAPLAGSGGEFATLAVEPQLVLAIETDVPYRTQRFNLTPGTSLLLYTDGVTDVQAPAGERLGIEGVQKSLYGSFTRAQTLLDSTLDAIESFRAGREPSDDLTLVAVQLGTVPAAEAEAPTTSAEPLDSRHRTAKV
jgi:phosphoserine phosphatase RsbU/P